MKILIKTLDGHKKPFEFHVEDIVSKIKDILAEKTGIYKDMIRLIYKGSPMKDEKTLKEHKIEKESVIHMIMQMRGG